MPKDLNSLSFVPKIIFFDFDGVFTDNKVYTTDQGSELVVTSKYDSLAISIFRKNNPNIYLSVISSESNLVVSQRCSKLGIDVHQNVDNKLLTCMSILENKKLKLCESMFVLNDINDLELSRNVKVSICVADSPKEVKEKSSYVTNCLGGNGAIREILENIQELINNKELDRNNKDKGIIPRILQSRSVGERDWGEEIMLSSLPNHFTFKKLLISKGSKGGLQYHRLKHEFGYLISGKLLVRYALNSMKLEEMIVLPGQTFEFPPFCIHQEEALDDCVILEVSNPYLNDRVRVEHLFPQYNLSKSGLPSTNIEDIQYLG